MRLTIDPKDVVLGLQLGGKVGCSVLQTSLLRKDRQLFAGNGSVQAVREWLAIRGPAPGPLFVPINKSGRLVPRRLSDKAVTHILQERAAEATITAFQPT